MTEPPLFETPAVLALTAANGHLAHAHEAAHHEDQSATLTALEQLAAATAAANSAEAHLVREARRQRATWHQIAAALGVTRQAAAARFGARGVP